MTPRTRHALCRVTVNDHVFGRGMPRTRIQFVMAQKHIYTLNKSLYIFIAASEAKYTCTCMALRAFVIIHTFTITLTG